MNSKFGWLLYLQPIVLSLFISILDSSAQSQLAKLRTALEVPANVTQELVISQDSCSWQYKGDTAIQEKGTEIFIDCKRIPEKYFTSVNYFSTWDTKNVNPYYLEKKILNDTAVLNLTDNGAWSFPLKRKKEVKSDYGPRRYRFHHGIDVDITIGEPVYAAFDGVVRIAKYNYRGYGYYVMIRHDNGLETLYGHLKKYTVKPGSIVKAGDQIGLAGNTGRSTGPHLHFEARYQGYAFDPNYLFDFDTERLKSEVLVISPKVYEKLIDEYKAVYHRIRSGDSLWLLARRYRTSIGSICRLNRISRRTVLRIGRRIRVR